jgi:mannose-6-phosphate isomerase-like protein (cupin superfamily)
MEVFSARFTVRARVESHAGATIGASLGHRVGNRRRISVIDEEEYGGDPPCWAHLFDEEAIGMENEQQGGAEASAPALLTTGQGQMVDLAALAHSATAPGAIWTRQSEDLNVNLLVFTSGDGVAEHVNAEVDVLLVGIAGTGAVTIDGTRQILSPGIAMVIPKGTSRSIRSMSDSFAYLTCHRRRTGLWPGRKP